jgi:mono/diheme cytochrome c family protein
VKRARNAGVAALAAAIAALLFAAGASAEDGAAQRGRAVLEATGGCTCHSDAKGGGGPLSGGRAMKTPFGVFYSTNITPDPETGIGRWSDADFVRAMREGLAPDGHAYFPVFPYPSFTGMSDEDVLALKAYLFTLAPVRRENRPHDAMPPFSWRIAAAAWRWMFFEPGRVVPDPAQSPEWNRGAYLVSAVAHCGECHTPRSLPGALDRSRWLAGSKDGPEGELAPNLTPDVDTGIGLWTKTDMVWFLQTGQLPDGDDTEGLMAEVIEHGYQQMPEPDLQAIAVYLHSLPPVRNDALAEHEHDHDHDHEPVE